MGRHEQDGVVAHLADRSNEHDNGRRLRTGIAKG